MGHDILGYNKIREEIAYARFSMGNYNATKLYSLLNADGYNAGVSGTGDIATFSVQQMEKALNSYKQLCHNGDSSLAKDDSLNWDQKQILSFISNCLTTAKEEGSVMVYFG